MRIRRLTFIGGALALGAALVACQAVPSQFAEHHAGDSTVVVAASGAAQEAPTGGVVFTVRWPERRVQYIPDSATAIRFGVYRIGNPTALATGSVSRTNQPSSSLAFTSLPVDYMRFTAEAVDPDGHVGASGSVTVQVQPNTLTPVRFSLESTLHPNLSGYSPSNGCPGQQVTLTGTDFGPRDASVSISLGGVSVPASQIFRLGDSTIAFRVPDGATTGGIGLIVGGMSATTTLESTIFTTIASLSVNPAVATMGAGEDTIALAVTARDHFGNPVPSPVVPWSRLSQDCGGCGTSASVASIDENGTVTRGNVTGSARFGVGIAPVLATASIEVE